MRNKSNSTSDPLSIKDKISQVSEEIRIVLPCTGVILGFQLTVPFSYGFMKLSLMQLIVYLASLISVVLSIIFLIAPVALDRLTEDDLDLHIIYKFTNRMIRLSLLALSLGISFAIFLVTSMIAKSFILALAMSLIIFILCQSLWFCYSLYINQMHKK